jgi:polyisoprenoid-binding protein YceI
MRLAHPMHLELAHGNKVQPRKFSMKVNQVNKSVIAGSLLLTVSVISAIANETADRVDIESGTAVFEASTNVPGVEVKGKSASLRGRVAIARAEGRLVLEEIEATVPVKSLSTGMGVRDEHMRKYIFTTADGQLPDLRFAAGNSVCEAGGAQQFTCRIAGSLTIRGSSQPFTISLNVKEQNGSFRASGDTVVKLSSFGIAPPTQFGVKTADDVKLRLEFTGKQKQTLTSEAGAVR